MSWYEFNSFVLAEADFCIVICLTALCLDSESYSFSSYFSLVVHTLELKSVHTPHSSKIDTVGGANTFAPYCKSTFLRVVHFAFFSYLAPPSMTFSWPDGLGHVGLQRHVRFARRRVLGRRRQFVVTAARRPLFSEFCGCVQFSTKPRCIVEAATAFRGVNSVLLCLVCM